MDRPSERKVHTKSIPRLGGLAMYIAFCLPFLIGMLFSSSLREHLLSNCNLPWVFGGATLVFLMGLMDDVRRLRPGVKLTVQLVAALMSYMAGIDICRIELPWDSVWTLGWFSLPVTILWFLTVINGINLIDGLDGLASGVTLFASLVLLTLSIMEDRYMVALGLASLAGASLGFLRYNFNPASIFMGDSGSYFLGYMLAALSVLGSMKSHATVALLIPIIALGLPLVDTTLAPIRRFLLGKNPFEPDRNHIHHKLLAKGLTHRKVVLLMYGTTILLGLAALVIVKIHDERAAAILLILGLIAVLGIRKLGYLEYIGYDKVIGYLQDVADEAGLQRQRRAFLDKQIAINQAGNADEMWEQVIDAMEFLKIDVAEIQFNGVCFIVPEERRYKWCKRPIPEEAQRSSSGSGPQSDEFEHRILSIELPLVDERHRFATLTLKKDILNDPITPSTLRRVEHLRRSIVRKLRMLEDERANSLSTKAKGEH